MATFIDYNGKLALAFGWWADQDKPIETRTLHVSDCLASMWPLVIGMEANNWNRNHTILHVNGRPLHVDTTDWQTIVEERPIPKPRKRKRKGLTIDWEYCWGKWREV